MWVARPGAVLLPILLGKIWNSWWNAWWNSCRSITARYFIRILCDQWIFRTVLGKYQWLNDRRISLLSTPKLPCEYTRYSFCLGLRVIYYQTYLLSEPVICNWQDVWIGARYSGIWVHGQVWRSQAQPPVESARISNQKSFHGWFQHILYITKGKLPFFIWSPKNQGTQCLLCHCSFQHVLHIDLPMNSSLFLRILYCR